MCEQCGVDKWIVIREDQQQEWTPNRIHHAPLPSFIQHRGSREGDAVQVDEEGDTKGVERATVSLSS